MILALGTVVEACCMASGFEKARRQEGKKPKRKLQEIFFKVPKKVSTALFMISLYPVGKFDSFFHAKQTNQVRDDLR